MKVSDLELSNNEKKKLPLCEGDPTGDSWFCQRVKNSFVYEIK